MSSSTISRTSSMRESGNEMFVYSVFDIPIPLISTVPAKKSVGVEVTQMAGK
ncbi:MAG: hypothetical protein ACT6FG_00130 [Methanosarcinaceae archaeon]